MAKVTPLTKTPTQKPERVHDQSSGIVKRARVSTRLIQLSAVLCVALPTLLAGLYYAFVAADQYEVRTQFAIRGLSSGIDMLGFTQLLGSSAVQHSDSYIVVDYIESTEVIADIQRHEGIDLRQIFANPNADWLVRGNASDPTNIFVDYWRGRIDVGFNSTTGIITFAVRAFTSEDAQMVAQAVLSASERLVNVLSSKAREELIVVAKDEVERTEQRLRQARQAVRRFRDREQTIDPAQIATSQLQLIGNLEAQVAELQARRDAVLVTVDPNSPSVRVLDRQIGGLTRQIEEQRSRLGSGNPGLLSSGQGAEDGDRTLSRVVGDYLELTVEQEFAETAYASALAALETAIAEGRKQQRYFAVFVEPHRPDISLHPQRMTNTILILIGSLVLWSLVLLLVAAIREHKL